ncbi:MAG: hypothetical protein WAX77_11300 [Methylococcaceae bacterium]
MIQDTIAALELHFERARDTYNEIQFFIDALETDTLNKEQIKTIDAFIFRYIKIQDLMGDKLFKEFLICVEDYNSNMTMLDVVHKLEKIEILDSALTWFSYRTLRNALTHEYPNNRAEIIAGILKALTVFNQLHFIYQKIVSYLLDKQLLSPANE